MRIFLAVFLIAATSAEFQSRIHGGISNKTITSFVHLEIVFDRGTKYCGGVLVSPGDRILTAGSCVYDYTLLSGFLVGDPIKVSFGSSIRMARKPILVKQKFFVGGDLAVLILEKPAKQLVRIPHLKEATVSTVGTADVYVGTRLTVCGFGETDNHGTLPTTLKCTTMLVVPKAQCTAGMTALQSFLMNLYLGFICLSNPDDSNTCSGDSGGALYSADGTVVGIVSYHVGARSNAGCTDGHMVVATQLGSYASLLTNPLVLKTIPDFPVF